MLEGSTGGQHPQIMDEWRQLKDRLKLWLQQSRVPVAENEQVYQDGSEKTSSKNEVIIPFCRAGF